MISIVLDNGVAVINKTKWIFSLCGVYVSPVKIDRNLYFKKTQNCLTERGNRYRDITDSNYYEENKQGMSFRAGFYLYLGFGRLF